jgi:hypothetical protein
MAIASKGHFFTQIPQPVIIENRGNVRMRTAEAALSVV